MCIQIANAERLALEAAARVFEPPPAVDYVEWAKDNIIFSDRESPYPGPFSVERFPHGADPWSAFAGRSVPGGDARGFGADRQDRRRQHLPWWLDGDGPLRYPGRSSDRRQCEPLVEAEALADVEGHGVLARIVSGKIARRLEQRPVEGTSRRP